MATDQWYNVGSLMENVQMTRAEQRHVPSARSDIFHRVARYNEFSWRQIQVSSEIAVCFKHGVSVWDKFESIDLI